MKEMKIITFKGMPLFQRASFECPFIMDGELKDVACFFYVGKGTMTSYDKRGAHVTSLNNAILKSCGKYVQVFSSLDEDNECVATAVFLYPELLKEIYKDEIPSYLVSGKTIDHRTYIGNELVEQYMNNLSIYFESPETFDEELGVLKLKELMLILLKSENSLSIRELLSEVFSPTNITIREAVENNLTNNISIEQLAYICNMSLSTFKREFRKNFNDSPARYVKHKRLEAAEKQLLISEESIGSIAFDLGFEDLSTFSANFKEKFGASPSIYRKNQINKSLN